MKINERIIIYLTIFLFGYCNFSISQWVFSGLSGQYVYAVHNTGTRIFAGATNTNASSDNGNSWTIVLNTAARCFASGSGRIFAGSSLLGVYLSTNNGLNWTQINNGLTSLDVKALAVSGINTFAGTAGGGVFLTKNNGINWTPVNNGLTSNYIYSLLVNGTDVYAGAGHSIRGIFKSTNDGTNWFLSGVSNHNINCMMSALTNIFAGTDTGVYISTDNGLNWTVVNNGLLNLNINSLASSDSIIFAGTHNGVYYSTNNGLQWVSFSSGLPQSTWIYGLTVNYPFIFAGAYGTGVWRRPIAEVVPVRNRETRSTQFFSIFQNYPNPFNPSSKIKFQIPKSGLVKLIVFDVLGHEVTKLVNEKLIPGTYQVEWDGTNYPNGVYFYKLITSNYTETKKMVLVK